MSASRLRSLLLLAALGSVLAGCGGAGNAGADRACALADTPFAGAGWVGGARVDGAAASKGYRVFLYLHPGTPRSRELVQRVASITGERDDVECIGLLATSSADAARAAVDRLGLTSAVLYGVSTDTLRRRGITQAPALYVVDARGRLIARDLVGLVASLG